MLDHLLLVKQKPFNNPFYTNLTTRPPHAVIDISDVLVPEAIQLEGATAPFDLLARL